MKDEPNYWLLLEKSDATRVSKGIDAYRDKTGEVYHYDSKVPNHKQVKESDFIVIRKEDSILGIGSIGTIKKYADIKKQRRCTKCRATDIRERSTMLPKWKCGKCAHEFLEPIEEQIHVMSYDAKIEGFAQLNKPPTVKVVKECAVLDNGTASQLSILKLDKIKLTQLIEGLDVYLPKVNEEEHSSSGQGFGLSHLERKAVELKAMEIATDLYKNCGWEVYDKSNSHPYDLFAVKGDKTRYIEVKGTTGPGQSIVLTHGEVDHAMKNNKMTALVVVSNIMLKSINGAYHAEGGEITLHKDPWKIDKKALSATQYSYSIRQS